MERLTEKFWKNLDPLECCGQDRFCRRGCHDLGGCTNWCIVPKLYARLAAYEDAMPLERAQDLAQAEKDGRLVALPCKVGDTIYVISYEEIVETKVRTFFLGHPSHNIEKRNMRMIRTTNWDISMDEIGKRIFFTREEAEAALKKMEDAQHEN